MLSIAIVTVIGGNVMLEDSKFLEYEHFSCHLFLIIAFLYDISYIIYDILYIILTLLLVGM